MEEKGAAIKKLMKGIASGEIKIDKLLLYDEWLDDHIVCATAEINDMKVDFWYVGVDGYASLKYAMVCEQAMEDTVKLIKSQLDDELFD